jgi:hypothetical protein
MGHPRAERREPCRAGADDRDINRAFLSMYSHPKPPRRAAAAADERNLGLGR